MRVLPRPASRNLLLLCRSPKKHYHTRHSPPPASYTPTESAILSAALAHVPHSGFSLASLRAGLRATGYRDASAALFPAGAFEIVRYHLRSQRAALAEKPLPFPLSAADAGRGRAGGEGSGAVEQNVRALVLARLRGNVEAGVVERWSEALGWMSLAGNVPGSVEELALLSDEILFLAGDMTVDAGWYGKRAGLSATYAATELFQSQDRSKDFRDTEQFLDRRLKEVGTLGSTVRNVGEWASFQGSSAINLARSWGMRI